VGQWGTRRPARHGRRPWKERRLIVHKADGTTVTGEALIGAVIVGIGPEGRAEAFRIDSIEKDAKDPDGDVYLYTFSTRDPKTSEWKPMCNPDPQGVAKGFPLSGSWNSAGVHLRTENFSISCTSGVIGKCVRLGYKPWKTARDGKPMWDYHQACTRMMRADYCGNGLGHTKTGTHIDVIDQIGVMNEFSPELSFEAAWTAEGATCVAKTRLPGGPWSLESIVKECPEKLKGRVGDPETCNVDMQRLDKQVLLFNRS
jgi:hypothetical protein